MNDVAPIYRRRDGEHTAVLTLKQAHDLVTHGRDHLLRLVIPEYDELEDPVTEVQIYPGKAELSTGYKGMELERIEQGITDVITSLDRLSSAFHNIDETSC